MIVNCTTKLLKRKSPRLAGVIFCYNYRKGEEAMEQLSNNEQQDQALNQFEGLSQDREYAEKVKQETFYSGIFVNREELYNKAPAHLKNTIEKPHVTTNFAPDETQLHLESLGSESKITAIGYGNNGKNEGLLVKVESDDPIIQKAIDSVKVPHITLSYSDGSHPMYTSDLEFTPLSEPFELSGEYCLHLKNDTLINNGDTLRQTII